MVPGTEILALKFLKITVPASATVSIEYEAGDREEELEFEIKWKS